MLPHTRKRIVRRHSRRALAGFGLTPSEHRVLATEGKQGLEDIVNGVRDAVDAGDCMGSYWMLLKANKMLGREMAHARSADDDEIRGAVRKLSRTLTELAEETGDRCVTRKSRPSRYSGK